MRSLLHPLTLLLAQGPQLPIVVMLYREMYFRHIHAKLRPTIFDRIDAYNNYIDLFNYFLGLLLVNRVLFALLNSI